EQPARGGRGLIVLVPTLVRLEECSISVDVVGIKPQTLLVTGDRPLFLLLDLAGPLPVREESRVGAGPRLGLSRVLSAEVLPDQRLRQGSLLGLEVGQVLD